MISRQFFVALGFLGISSVVSQTSLTVASEFNVGPFNLQVPPGFPGASESWAQKFRRPTGNANNEIDQISVFLNAIAGVQIELSVVTFDGDEIDTTLFTSNPIVTVAGPQVYDVFPMGGASGLAPGLQVGGSGPDMGLVVTASNSGLVMVNTGNTVAPAGLIQGGLRSLSGTEYVECTDARPMSLLLSFT